jgi:hypothetical protein
VPPPKVNKVVPEIPSGTVFKDNVPWLTVVVPVYEFDPERIVMPAPVFTRLPAPLRLPAYVVLRLLFPTSNVTGPGMEFVSASVKFPAPASPPKVKVPIEGANRTEPAFIVAVLFCKALAWFKLN